MQRNQREEWPLPQPQCEEIKEKKGLSPNPSPKREGSNMIYYGWCVWIKRGREDSDQRYKDTLLINEMSLIVV